MIICSFVGDVEMLDGIASNPSILFEVCIDFGTIGELGLDIIELLILAASDDGGGCIPKRNADEKRAVG